MIAQREGQGGAAAGKWLTFLPAAVATVLLLVMVKAVWDAGAYYTSGNFAYALDDPYIHMALAKNLSRHGVFGATPYEFTSASSSPLWTLMLAVIYKLGGVRDLTSLVMTTVFSLGLLFCADYVMRRLDVEPVLRLVTLGWICVATPLVAIIYGGMEHPLQILIDILFVFASAAIISREEAEFDRLAFATIGLAAAATAVRYEGAVLVGLVVALLAVRKRLRLALAIGAAGVMPIVAYGVVSVLHGGFFLPNSVLVKGATTSGAALLGLDFASFWQQLAIQAQGTYPLYVLMATAGTLLVMQLRSSSTRWRTTVVAPAVALTTAVIQVLFGETGWLYRYEAYLMVLLAVGVVAQLSELARGAEEKTSLGSVLWLIGIVLAVASVGTGAVRGWAAWQATPRAMENVYEQMYQTAHFLKDNPQYSSVAIGDLGAVAYYNDNLRILDLEGLAETGEPLDSLGRYNSTAADIAARAEEDGAQIAIVFPDYFDLPEDWVEVARWTISYNISAYADTVAFLAIPPTDPVELAVDVRDYTLEKLPRTVGAQGIPIPEE